MNTPARPRRRRGDDNQITVYFDADTARYLRDAAEERNVTIGSIVREAVAEYRGRRQQIEAGKPAEVAS